METIKHNRQPITEEMIEEFKNTYRLPTKEEEAEILIQLCKGSSGTILKLETFEKEEDKK